MSPSKSDLDSDLIVAHLPYVRRLASQLVFDADLAKDIEQDVLLAALGNALRDQRSIKGWLASIVRHVASKAFRARERRTARELAVTSEPVPTPTEILASEELRRSLVEHVLALDEPVRPVMILRYFEELPPREVARRLGIPVETARTRTKRGLELLRARLEREGGRGRGAWCLALVTGLRLEPPSLSLAGASALGASLSGAAMTLSNKLAVAFVLLASTVWIVVQLGKPTPPSEEPAREGNEVSLAGTATPSDARTQEPVADSRTAIPALPAESAKEVPTTGSALLRVHWFNGIPAAGVRARIHQAGTDFYADTFDVVTGMDGVYVVEQLNLGWLAIVLDRGPSGGCEIVAGEQAEVVMTIPRGFDISGRVMERDGRPVPSADILLDQMGGGWTGHVVARSDADGHFEIRSASEGLAWVSARAAFHAPSPQRQLIGGSTEFENVELIMDPVGATLEGVVYGADSEPLPYARVLVGAVDAFDQVRFEDGGRGRVPAAQAVECDERGRFVVAGVPIGRVPVRVRGKGYSPWVGEVETIDQRAAHAEIRLVRGTTLAGVVTDGSGAPIQGAEVQGNDGDSFASRYSRTTAEGRFTMQDLPAGEFHVLVQAEGFEEAEKTLSGVPGGQLSWNPVLGAGLSIRGRLVLSDTNFEQWHVKCQSQDWKGAPFRSDVRPNAEGVFEINGCADVAHSIEIYSPETNWQFPTAERKDIFPGAAELVIMLDTDALPSCRLRGRIVDELGAPLPGTEFGVRLEARNTGPVLTAEADGTFDVGPYPPGRYAIAVRAAGFVPNNGDFVDVPAHSKWDFGDLQLHRGGTIAVRLKRDATLTETQVSLVVFRSGIQQRARLPLQGDEARSEFLLPGEYLVQLQGRSETDIVAQRTGRAIVRVGEEAVVELPVQSGMRYTIAFTPPGTGAADVKALDNSGGVVWEDRIGQNQRVVLPLTAIRLLARDEAIRSAEVPLPAVPVADGQVIMIELK